MTWGAHREENDLTTLDPVAFGSARRRVRRAVAARAAARAAGLPVTTHDGG